MLQVGQAPLVHLVVCVEVLGRGQESEGGDGRKGDVRFLAWRKVKGGGIVGQDRQEASW
jgi:hypothetical protein